MEIYLVRHTSVDVPKGVCYGRSDVRLNSTFEEEAEAVKRRLDGVAFDGVFSSPMTRAVRLADYCGFSKKETDERLLEFNFGEWEMRGFDDLFVNDKRFATWCDNYLTERAPNGESFLDQMARVNDFIDEKKSMGYKRIVAFCHGGVLACGLIRVGKVEAKDALASVPPYGSVVRIEV